MFFFSLAAYFPQAVAEARRHQNATIFSELGDNNCQP